MREPGVRTVAETAILVLICGTVLMSGCRVESARQESKASKMTSDPAELDVPETEEEREWMEDETVPWGEGEDTEMPESEEGEDFDVE
ncbi:MAG: hypothetical protein ISS31_08495 [Kiritimatiellae bacterium]|nr:hypothetical protein [Kiritimatiellia bacterium]